MSTAYLSLMKREWQLRRSLFWFLMTYLICVVGYCMAYEIEHRTHTVCTSFYQSVMIFGQIGSLLLAMSTTVVESSRKELLYTASLPVSLQTVGWGRVLSAWLCLIVPVVTMMLFVMVLVLTGTFEQAIERLHGSGHDLPERPLMPPWKAITFLWKVTAIALAGSIQLVSVMLVVSTCCRREGTMGLVGTIFIMLVMVTNTLGLEFEKAGLYFAADWFGAIFPQSLAISWGYGQWDGSSYTDLEVQPNAIPCVIVNLLISMGLAVLFAQWYGRKSIETAVRSRTSRWRLFRRPRIIPAMGIRWSHSIPALCWLNLRRAVPLCLSGLVLAVVLTLISNIPQFSVNTMSKDLAGNLYTNTWFIGVLWATVVASGIFAAELSPALGQFWRSRPISPVLWFWTKYLVGLVAVIVVLDVIPDLLGRSSFAGVNRNGRTLEIASIVCMPLWHWATYSFAVLAISVIRRPIPAAIAALLMFFVFESVLASIPAAQKLSLMDIHNRLERAGRQADFRTEGFPLAYGSLILIAVITTSVACRKMAKPGLVGLMMAAFGLGAVSNAAADETRIPTEIVKAIRDREQQIVDLQMTVDVKTIRTDAYFDLMKAQRAEAEKSEPPSLSRRSWDRYQHITPPEETSHFEISIREPAIAWMETSDDGKLRELVAFDGTTGRKFHSSNARLIPDTFEENLDQSPGRPNFNSSPIPVILEQEFRYFGGNRLADLLESHPVKDVRDYERDGEKLVDLTIQTKSAQNESIELHDWMQLTLNSSRGYQLQRIQFLQIPENPASANGIQPMEIRVGGWQESRAVTYPQKITVIRGRTPQVVMESTTYEFKDLRINSGLADSAFEFDFQKIRDRFFYDTKTTKPYQLDSTGHRIAFTPRPAGIQGAVFVYHLIWISTLILLTWTGRLNWRSFVTRA